MVTDEGDVFGQSRNRLLSLDADNHGFARWVFHHSAALADVLGPGYHYGEWWGNGIQRGYGLTTGDKRFSLFNTHRWAGAEEHLSTAVTGLGVVPILAIHTFSDAAVRTALTLLRDHGSVAAPGFPRPEGVVVYHTAADQVFKALLERDELPKALAA